ATCDIDLVGTRGRLICRLESWEDRRFELPSALLALRIDPQGAMISAPHAADDAACCRLDTLTEAFAEANQGIWLEMLAHLVLSRRERGEWRQLDHAPARRREWLSDRIVAKDAVRLLARQQRGARLTSAHIDILHAADGGLEAHGDWRVALSLDVAVSLSHERDRAVAMATLRTERAYTAVEETHGTYCS